MTEYIQMTNNEIIQNTLAKAQYVCGHYNNIMCSVSGGADSDVIMDIMFKADKEHKVKYIFFNTGIEYQATLDHLDDLEAKYGVEIERISPKLPVGAVVRKYGYPFISKYVSEQIKRLQKINFQWEDEPYDVLVERYGKNSALKWWCNEYTGSWSIGYVKKLKEFMIANPPQFKISADCCKYAKKDLSKELVKERGFDCVVIGVRKAEGGIRKDKYESCLDEGHFRPILEWSDEDRLEYEKLFDIEHSEVYSKWGFTRTGCALCPFSGKGLGMERWSMSKHEPKKYMAVMKIFEPSIEYEVAFTRFREKDKLEWFRERERKRKS